MPSSGTLRRRYRTLRSSACSANVAFAHERSGQRNRRTAKMISTGRPPAAPSATTRAYAPWILADTTPHDGHRAHVARQHARIATVSPVSSTRRMRSPRRRGNNISSGDQELAAFAEETTALLEKAQQPDGYLNSAVQVHGQPRYSNLAHSHEMHCAGHLIQAGVACLRGAGLDRLLGVARRFADHLVNTFLGQLGGLDGYPIVETAVVELYRETGHRPYLELAS